MAQYYIVSKDSIDASADAIRSKTGSQSAIEWDGNEGFADAIDAISGGGVTPTGTKQISITQNGTTTEDVTNYASAEITVNVPSIFTLIGQTTIALSEYTDTSTAETTNTQINIMNTNYAYFIVIITCDSEITTSTEWGMTVGLGGRYTTNGKFLAAMSLQQKGSATLSYSDMDSSSAKQESYGVTINGNTETIQIVRKAHSSGMPKIRAGNYTIKVYAMTSM